MQRATIQWIGGGLATASFACLTQILTLDLDKLSRSLHIAVLIFAISIPLDVFMFLTPTIKEWKPPHCWSKNIYAVIMIIFAPISFSGFAAVFWHFSYLYAVIFIGVSLVLYAIFHWIGCDLQKLKR
jgi:hypothetical protein